MIILSLDTCDPHGSVALIEDGKPLQMVVHDTREEYSAWLLPAINRLLRSRRTAMSDVDFYAVAVGPGSFTGVRVGLTTVKAWAEVYGKSAAPVSRLEAVASQREETAPLIGAFLDASRGQIFGALYGHGGGELRLIEEERVADPDEFLEFADRVAGGRQVHWISSDPERMEGSERWHATREERGPVKRVGRYLAEAIGLIGYKKALKGQTVDGLGLDANYVRRPDAEVLWKGIAAKSLIDSQKKKREICVRGMLPADSVGVLAVTGGSPEAAQWTPETFCSEASRERIWVAEDCGEIAGFLVARIIGEEAEILNLAVAGKARRKGIATKLLVRASDEMSHAGAKRCFLEVRESNAVAKMFYTKMAFETIGTRPRYYQHPEEGALCMEKKLTDQDHVPT